VIYKLNNNKETTGDAKINSKSWMVLTCGYNPTKQESVLKLTLEQYLLDYIKEEKSDIKIRLASKTLGATVNEVTFFKETPPKFPPEVIDICINHLLTEPGKESELSRRYTAFIKAQKK